MLVVFAKANQVAVGSQMVLMVGPTPTARTITSVYHTSIYSSSPGWFVDQIAGGPITLLGSGFDDIPEPSGYSGVVGGYFGVGTPGSCTNPLISAIKGHQLLCSCSCRGIATNPAF
jgi:hypothetical protein